MAEKKASGRITPVIALGLIVLLFIFGIAKLFMLRFSTGDIYPPYSSLRSDPLGAKVFYESLNNLKDISADRNYQSLPKLKGNENTALFLFGLPVRSLRYVDGKEVEMLERFAAEGGRLVFMFYPEGKESFAEKVKKKEKKEKNAAGQKEKKKCPDGSPGGCGQQLVSLEERWGFHPVYDEKMLQPPQSGAEQAACNAGGNEKRKVVCSSLTVDTPALPKSISLHSPWYFELKDARWQTVYDLNSRPVVIEKKLGKGSLVLATDSYMVSNEAMLKERQAGFLLWLTGNKSRVIYDETHFGMRETPGVAALARKYRLHGLFAGFLLLAGLFIWKNSVSLVPAYESRGKASGEDITSGRDYLSGFVNLLSRNIQPHDLPAVCLDEWKKTFRRRLGSLGGRLKDAETIIESGEKMPARRQRPVEVYNKISILLQRGNKDER